MAVFESRALCLSARDSFLPKRSVEKEEVKRAPVVTLNLPMNRPEKGEENRAPLVTVNLPMNLPEKGEEKRAPVLTVNLPMNRPYRKTCYAILSETSLAEESIETRQSPAIVRISPV